MKEDLKKKVNEKFTKMENKGFHFANKMHRYAVNGCLLFIGYQIFVFLREYNNFFLHARKVKKMEEFDQEGPINKSINSDDY